jgi:hypothetical protein
MTSVTYLTLGSFNWKGWKSIQPNISALQTTAQHSSNIIGKFTTVINIIVQLLMSLCMNDSTDHTVGQIAVQD